jgi:hypothetical protein
MKTNRSESIRYGRLSRVAISFYLKTGNPAELDAVYVYAKLSARFAAISICGECLKNLTVDENSVCLKCLDAERPEMEFSNL